MLLDPHDGLQEQDPASRISGYRSLYSAQTGEQD